MAELTRDGVPKKKHRNKPPTGSDYWNGAKGGFAGIPRRVMDGPDFMSLNGASLKLLMELAYQTSGNNNGDLTVAWSVLSKRGFKSKDTIERAAKELLARGLIVKTRRGASGIDGKRQPTLYGLTWLPINAVNDDGGRYKFDVEPTRGGPIRTNFTESHNGQELTTPTKHNLTAA